MATISLFTSGATGLYDHEHITEDITSQIDGITLVFTTSQPYRAESLTVIYDGVVYTRDNDFTETDTNEFTFVNDDPFPPEIGCPLVVEYIAIII